MANFHIRKKRGEFGNMEFGNMGVHNPTISPQTAITIQADTKPGDPRRCPADHTRRHLHLRRQRIGPTAQAAWPQLAATATARLQLPTERECLIAARCRSKTTRLRAQPRRLPAVPLDSDRQTAAIIQTAAIRYPLMPSFFFKFFLQFDVDGD